MSEKDMPKAHADNDIEQQINDGFKWLNSADLESQAVAPLKDRASTVQTAIEQNKHLDFDEQTGNISVSNKPPEEGEVHKLNSDMRLYLERLALPINGRINLRNLLEGAGDVAGVEKVLSEASEKSRDLPTDLIKRQISSTVELLKTLPKEANREAYEEYLRFLADPDSGLLTLSDQVQKIEMQHYTGAAPVIAFDAKGSITGVVDMRFGAGQRFDPEKAFEIAQQIREQSIKTWGKDPLTSGDKEGSQFFPSQYSTLDFDKNNIYAVAEQLSGRRFQGIEKLDATEFARLSLSLFNGLDTNGDKVVDERELHEKLKQRNLPVLEKQAVSTMIDVLPTLQTMDRAGSSRGLAREDLQAFLKVSVETSERLEKIKDARNILLFNNTFGAADANGNGNMTSTELKRFIKHQNPNLSNRELQSFSSLQNEYSNISKSWWGMTKSDLVDLRPASVKSVESSLWKNYYDSRAAEQQTQR